MQRSQKLELLVRQNKGRTEYPHYATELSHVLKVVIDPTDILDLHQTDQLFELHRTQSVRGYQQMHFAFKKVWRYEPKTAWLCLCDCLKEKLVDEAAVLFAGPFDLCGGLKVRVDCVLSAIVPLLKFDQDSIRLQSLSSETGLVLDLFEQDSEWMAELVVWGKWKSIAESCDGK